MNHCILLNSINMYLFRNFYVNILKLIGHFLTTKEYLCRKMSALHSEDLHFNFTPISHKVKLIKPVNKLTTLFSPYNVLCVVLVMIYFLIYYFAD